MLARCRNIGNMKYLLLREPEDRVTLIFFRKDYEQVHENITSTKAKEIIDRKILTELKAGR